MNAVEEYIVQQIKHAEAYRCDVPCYPRDIRALAAMLRKCIEQRNGWLNMAYGNDENTSDIQYRQILYQDAALLDAAKEVER